MSFNFDYSFCGSYQEAAVFIRELGYPIDLLSQFDGPKQKRKVGGERVVIDTSNALQDGFAEWLELANKVVTKWAYEINSDGAIIVDKEFMAARTAILSNKVGVNEQQAKALLDDVSSHDPEVFFAARRTFAKCCGNNGSIVSANKAMAVLTRGYGMQMPLPVVHALLELYKLGNVGEIILYDKPITNGCVQAAQERIRPDGVKGIPLRQELKSMLFKAQERFGKETVFLHFIMPGDLKMPGDHRRVDSDCLSSLLSKNSLYIEFKNSLIQDKKVLEELLLEPGSLNPLSTNYAFKELCKNSKEEMKLIHIVDPHIFAMLLMHSNLGWPTRAVAFDPWLLMEAIRKDAEKSNGKIVYLPLEFAVAA